jgi:hypothetical protein
MSMESHGGMILTKETKKRGEKPVPVPLCPSQILRGLTRVRTCPFAVKPGSNRLSHGTAFSQFSFVHGCVVKNTSLRL